MRKLIPALCVVLALAASLAAQSQRLWILRPPGEMVEYDPATFSAKQTVKVPAEAVAFTAELLGQSSRADAFRRTRVFAAHGGRSRVRAKSMVLGRPRSNHTDARGLAHHSHGGLKSGHHGVRTRAFSLSRWNPSRLVFEPGAPPAARWRGSFHEDHLAKLANGSCRRPSSGLGHDRVPRLPLPDRRL